MSPFANRLLRRVPGVHQRLRRWRRRYIPASDTRSQIQRVIETHLETRGAVFFLQVGSNDGRRGDPLFALVNDHPSWRGIFVEPVRSHFDALKDNYSHSTKYIFENKAIAEETGFAEFNYVSKDARIELGDRVPGWVDQLGSFDKGHILKHFDGMLEPYIVTERVDAVSIQDIFDSHGVTAVDLIHVDTEGHDFAVLSQIDFTRYRPAVVLYEHKHLTPDEVQQARTLLSGEGYACETYAGDTLALLNP